jgi:hypothetical protein
LTAFRTDKEIAAHLGISEATVKKHIHEACQRLGVNRRKAALAILEQNGPGYPNDPMAAATAEGPDARSDGGSHHGKFHEAAAAVELGRSGIGAGQVERVEAGQPAARASVATVEDRVGLGLAGGSARNDSDRRDPDLSNPFHYRAPPRGSLLRLTLVALAAVLISALLLSAGALVSDFHHVVDRFDPTTR